MMQAKWIVSPILMGSATVSFRKGIVLNRPVKQAVARVSSVGVYVLTLDGKRVGDRVLAPGFTSYEHRVLYQEYDLTEMLHDGSLLSIDVGPGWAVGSLGFTGKKELYADRVRAACELSVTYDDNSVEVLSTDDTWEAFTHPVTFSDIYHGETVDLTAEPVCLGKALVLDDGRFPLAPDNGAPICEQEHLRATLLITPKGERVLDFGQNMTGYVSLTVKAARGSRVVLSHGEVLDRDGNFYNANYRTAQNRITYILSGEEDSFKPCFSFQGFRYARIDEYPDIELDPGAFTAIVVHTQMDRIGHFQCGNETINQLYHNIIWGQKSNYLDIPTDCPQRDERLGWTGDAQVFCRVAGMNFDVRRFFEKWLTDLRLEQRADGAVMGTCPEQTGMHRTESRVSAAWGDIATVAPWTLYELYDDRQILADNFDLMRRWVDYMRAAGDEEYLWLGGYHYGDWLAMDAGEGSYVGATSNDLIASAYYAHSTRLLIRAGEVLGKDMSEYRALYEHILAAFRAYFTEDGLPKETLPLTEVLPRGKSSADALRLGRTQTAYTLMLHFGLCREEECEGLVDALCRLIEENGGKMATGFVGTPYLLHALSDNRRADMAYRLLLNEESPSWLYSVKHGATTIWEHWDGIREDGSFWSTDMNSFNHYAYGAVGDWLYGAVCGIRINEGGAGYRDITLSPIPSKRLGFAEATVRTPQGLLKSAWRYGEGTITFEFTVPHETRARICLPNGQNATVAEGNYCFSVPTDERNTI